MIYVRDEEEQGQLVIIADIARQDLYDGLIYCRGLWISAFSFLSTLRWSDNSGLVFIKKKNLFDIEPHSEK